MSGRKGYIYALSLVAAFVIFATSGDHLFLVPTPAPFAPEESKTLISPYVHISHFDHHFREAADTLNWDWKLVAAIGFVESRFDSTAQSAVGASGVMQVMPRTLRQFGVSDSTVVDSRTNIMAATNLLHELNRIFRRIKDPEERINFVLASYNAGVGHINDAMRLADKYGHNRYRWESCVDSFLIFKSRPEFYTDSLCKNGEFKDWRQTLSFVKKVKRKWRSYEDMQEKYNDSIFTILQNDSTAVVIHE